MDDVFYRNLAGTALAGEIPNKADSLRILSDPTVELLPLLNAAFTVRRYYWGREVAIHILNNAANGYCPEDCSYCAQSKHSQAPIEEYPIKSDQEILAEAEAAYNNGAHRYCMVFAGRGPSPRRIEKIADLIRQIKARYPVEVCVSAGLLDESGTARLKAAGLDRLNHNLNTSRARYPDICTTHTFDDRLNTLQAARKAGLEVCSGVIAGMGEKPEELVEVALQLREVNARSVPVNFLLPIDGTPIGKPEGLSPEYCLRILCLFRFLNPDAEIRAAAGREYHLRGMEVMALYPANSLFLQGYLNARGNSDARTLRMIRDAGFTIKSDVPLDDLLNRSEDSENSELPASAPRDGSPSLKKLYELRPGLKQEIS